MKIFMETYRSGHNGTDSKSVDPQGSVGSNPTVSAKQKTVEFQGFPLTLNGFLHDEGGCLIKRQPLNTKPGSCEESGFGVLFRCETKQNASRLYSIRDWISSELAHGYRNYDPVR